MVERVVRATGRLSAGIAVVGYLAFAALIAYANTGGRAGDPGPLGDRIAPWVAFVTLSALLTSWLLAAWVVFRRPELVPRWGRWMVVLVVVPGLSGPIFWLARATRRDYPPYR